MDFKSVPRHTDPDPHPPSPHRIGRGASSAAVSSGVVWDDDSDDSRTVRPLGRDMRFATSHWPVTVFSRYPDALVCTRCRRIRATQRPSYLRSSLLHRPVLEIVDDGMVVTRWTSTGTHQELRGISATGKAVRITGIHIQRIVEGRIVADWTNWDTLGMLQQLGVAR